MNTQPRSGFTIIEVMLFLAVSGALTVGLLVGSGAAINRQRYQDSVNTFKGVIQEQFNQVSNVVNGDNNNPECEMTNGSLSVNGTARPRGTSECLVVGRFLLIEPTRTTAYNLIGQPPEKTEKQDDVGVLGEYAYAVQMPETREISWGARIVRPKSSQDATVGVLITRSPISGSVLTYIKDLDDLNLSEVPEEERVPLLSGNVRSMIHSEHTEQKELCVDSDGALPALSKRRAVRIAAGATGPSAVEIALESDNVCDR